MTTGTFSSFPRKQTKKKTHSPCRWFMIPLIRCLVCVAQTNIVLFSFHIKNKNFSLERKFFCWGNQGWHLVMQIWYGSFSSLCEQNNSVLNNKYCNQWKIQFSKKLHPCQQTIKSIKYHIIANILITKNNVVCFSFFCVRTQRSCATEKRRKKYWEKKNTLTFLICRANNLLWFKYTQTFAHA